MILVLGGTGYIGSAFLKELDHRGYKFINVSRATHDYTNPTTLHQLLLIHNPEFVINAAGFTGVPNVDECELKHAETLAGNVVFPQILSLECRRLGVPFGHVSSGCVYNGHPPDGFRESDPPNFCFTSPPCSYYSGTKALAEECLIGHRCFIWRLRMPFDEEPHPKNYLTKLLTYPKLYDNVNSLSHRGQCVAACVDLWEHAAPYGIYNVTNPGSISTNMAVTLLNFEGLLENPKYFKDDREFYRVAKAPRSNCILNTDKLAAADVELPHIHDSIRKSITDYAHHFKYHQIA